MIQDHVLRLDELLRQDSATDDSNTSTDSLTTESSESNSASTVALTKQPSEDGTQSSSSGNESEDDGSPRPVRAATASNGQLINTCFTILCLVLSDLKFHLGNSEN